MERQRKHTTSKKVERPSSRLYIHSPIQTDWREWEPDYTATPAPTPKATILPKKQSF